MKLEIKRKQLVKAITEATYEVALPEQKVSCTLEHLPSNTGN